MLILFTGLPAASKTLNAIKMVNEDDMFCEYETDPNDSSKSIIKLDHEGKKIRRPVYYHNIKEVKLPWNQLDDDQAKKWFDLPSGSVIIFDECQDLFPILPSSKIASAPVHYSKMNTHRHYGHDIILITQHPKNLNTQIRRLINRHYHYKRLYGTDHVGEYIYQECKDEPLEHFSKKESEFDRVTIDKNYFGLYKSAEVHTGKPAFPWKRWSKFIIYLSLLLATVVLIIYFLTKLYTTGSLFGEEEESKPSNSSKSSLVQKTIEPLKTTPLHNEEYYSKLKPRIDGLPHTAPIYDDLTEPKSYPRIAACVNTLKTGCQCYTQQATKISVNDDICLNIVQNGYFDPMLPDIRSDDLPRSYASTQPLNSSRSSPKSLLIRSTGRY